MPIASNAGAAVVAVEARPEAERVAEPLPLVERVMLVGERGAGAVDASGGGAQQAGGDAQQARLADAVGAGHQRRLAGAERQAQPLEQDTPAAKAADVVEPQQVGHPACSSIACICASEKPK